MKRAGFTMIELIFVIVILGILAAVALPKFVGISEQAQSGKCLAAVGTMNRTVGPGLWSESLTYPGEIGEGLWKGSLTQGPGDWKTKVGAVKKAFAQFPIPAECTSGKSNDITNATVATDLGDTWFAGVIGAPPGTKEVNGSTITIGEQTFVIGFTDGNPTTAPSWKWYNTGAGFD